MTNDSHPENPRSPGEETVGEQLPDFESQPLSRDEYIMALAHLYRGELHRSLIWRLRLDTTTNWAILSTVAILTFSFNNPQYSSETWRELRSAEKYWGSQVADDLLRPRFHVTKAQAIKARLSRNFVYIFVFLLLAWVGRVLAIPEVQGQDLQSMFGIGALPHWVPVALVAVPYTLLVAVYVLTPKVTPPEICYWPDPDHPGEDVPSLDV
jgi:uncharacterized membrane protein